MSATAALIASTLNAGTPLLLAGIGILIHERSGVLNLGIEGIMLMGAVAGFGTCYLTGSFFLGFAAAALVGMVLSALFGFLTLGLYANQNAAGLAMAIFGAGLAAFIGQPLQGVSLAARASEGIPFLRDIPFVGDAFFSSHVLVYVALFMAGAAACFLYKSRWGLILRAAGESPKSAYALGYPVRTIRFAALLFGGLMTGVAGLFVACLYALVGRRNDGRPRLDCARARDVCDVAAAAHRVGGLPLRRRDDGAAQFPGGGYRHSIAIDVDGAVPGDDSGARPDQSQSEVDCDECSEGPRQNLCP